MSVGIRRTAMYARLSGVVKRLAAREEARETYAAMFRRAPEDKRPPKAWWDKCFAEAKGMDNVKNPSTFCGGLWFHPEKFKNGEKFRKSFGGLKRAQEEEFEEFPPQQKREMSPEALQALARTFAEYIAAGNWGMWYITDESKLTPEEEEKHENPEGKDWWEGLSADELLSKIKIEPQLLAEEVKQIAYDSGSRQITKLINLFSGKLSEEEYEKATDYIDDFTEHSH